MCTYQINKQKINIWIIVVEVILQMRYNVLASKLFRISLNMGWLLIY